MAANSERKIVNLFFGQSGRRKKKTKITFRNDEVKVIEGPMAATPIPQNFQVIEKYSLTPPFAYAVIAQDPEDKLPRYFIDEVPLSEQEKILYDKIITTLQFEIKAPRTEMDPRKYFADQAQRTANRYRMMPQYTRRVSWPLLLYYAERDMVGFGGLDPLMRDPNIEDVSIDSIKKPVFVFHRRYETLETNLSFDDEEKLDDTIVRLAHMSGKHVSTAFPIVDATLPGRHRLSATFRKEITPQGFLPHHKEVQRRPDHDHRPNQLQESRLRVGGVRLASHGEQGRCHSRGSDGVGKDHLPQRAPLHGQPDLEDRHHRGSSGNQHPPRQLGAARFKTQLWPY